MEKEPLGLLFKRIFNALKKDVDNHMKKHDLTMTQCIVLEYLKREEGKPVNQKDIERHFNLQHPTVSGILKRMERNGFVTCTVNENDRRFKNIELTQKAELIYDEILAHRKTVGEMFVRNFTQEESDQLYDLLKRVLENIRAKIEEDEESGQ